MKIKSLLWHSDDQTPRKTANRLLQESVETSNRTSDIGCQISEATPHFSKC